MFSPCEYLAEFEFVDAVLAQTLLPNGERDEWRFLAYLSMASRSGNVCVQVKDQAIHPLIPECPVTQELLAGAEKILERAELFRAGGPLRQEGDLVYFQKYWLYETEILQHLQGILSDQPDPSLDLAGIQGDVKQLVDQGQLLPEQADAIVRSSQYCLTVITGGPGTGKTYTAGHLISLLLQRQPDLQVALAAPTGKAAANLQNSLTKALQGRAKGENITSATLHALLHGIGKKRSVLPADLILVDECSMMDAQLTAELLALRKPGSRLILLGDKDQLPPVEAGSFFSDMVATPIPEIQQRVTQFTQCLRVELKTIVDFAAAIKEGILPPSAIEPKPFHPFLAQRQLCYQSLMDQFLHHIPRDLQTLSPQEWLTVFNRFRVLSPLRRGPFGVDVLNQRLMQAFQQRQGGGVFIVPIIIVKNDRRLNLYNGEVGVLVQKGDGKDEAYFPSGEAPGEVRCIPAMVLPRHEFAYCLSVHKSQGSEFDQVLLLLPPGSEIFGREVLYTAVTRAKKGLEIWADDDIFLETIKRSSERISGLSQRLASQRNLICCSESPPLDKI